MKLWRFSDPSRHDFAQAIRRGTWKGSPQRRVKPLVVEWKPGSDIVGDFTWPGFDSDIIITDSVARALDLASADGYELGPVKMIAPSTKAKERSEPLIPVPYTGPKLWDLFVTSSGEIDRARSTLLPVETPEGHERFKILGVEEWESVWEPDEGVLKHVHHPRKPGQGLTVSAPAAIFRLPEVPAWIFCTDTVKTLVEERRFSNVRFLEMGDIISNQ